MKNLIKYAIRLCCVGAVCALAGNASAAGFTVTDTATFTFVVGSSTTGPAGAAEWTEEHGDIGIEYEGGTDFELHYHFEDGVNGVPPEDIELEPDDAYIRVADAAKISPAPSLSFLNPGGGDIWVLPQSNSGPGGAGTLGVPYVGLATEELNPGQFPFGVDWELSAFSGPGDFALWQDGLGGPFVYMRTNDGVGGPGDTFSQAVGVHDHLNYGFTSEGVYDVTFTVTSTVPEPGSVLTLASFGAVGMLVRRRRRS